MRIDRTPPDRTPSPIARWGACGIAFLLLAGAPENSEGQQSPAAGPAPTQTGTARPAPPSTLLEADRKDRLVKLVTSIQEEIDTPGKLRPTLLNRKRLNLVLAHFELSILDLQGEKTPDFVSAADHIFYADSEIAKLDDALLNDSDKRVMRAITQIRGKATQFQLQALQAQVNELTRKFGEQPPAPAGGTPGAGASGNVMPGGPYYQPQPTVQPQPPGGVIYLYPIQPQATCYRVVNPAPQAHSLFHRRASRR